MTPVEELREAARVLRERAGAATPGPWMHTGSGPGQEHKGCGIVYTTDEDLYGGNIAAPAGDCYPRGGYSPDGDMAWIATVHPLVGLALADLLESVESVYGKDFNTVAAQPGHPLGPQLLALSRRILGGGS